MQESITARILSLLAEEGRSTTELLDCFLTDYHTSYRRLRGLSARGKRVPADVEEDMRVEKQRFYNLLSKLRRQGLVRHVPHGIWFPTARGIERNQAIALRLPRRTYEAQPSRELMLVAFDIPERERRKRIWLRATLKRLKFRMLQKSVWVGKVQLPEEFLDDLRALRLLPYVEILLITKTGSMRRVE